MGCPNATICAFGLPAWRAAEDDTVWVLTRSLNAATFIPNARVLRAGALFLADTSQQTQWMRAQDADTDVTTFEVFISICSMNIQIRSYANSAMALLHTLSAVKPYSRITTSPGADAP
jgi:hypothetical protein